jgi:uncharacterized protein (TIGR02145 family)
MKRNTFLLLFIICFLRGYGQRTGTFIDTRDGKVYKTIKMGNQTWFAENLAFKADSDCWAYNNDENNAAIYGYLYTWEAANNVCPLGWHLPSDGDWITLEKSLGMPEDEANISGFRGGNANIGGKLKSIFEWTSPNYGATMNEGFNALPGGNYSRTENLYALFGKNAMFWTSTPYNNELEWYRDLDYADGKVFRNYRSKNLAFSVRCVKNE